MELSIQDLLDKINKEGVDEALQKKEQIINKANEDAQKIVKDAKAEADNIVADAKREAEKLVKLFLYAAKSNAFNDEFGEDKVNNNNRNNREHDCGIVCTEIIQLIIRDDSVYHHRKCELILFS